MLKSVEDHLPLNQELRIPRLGTKDQGTDIVKPKPLSLNLPDLLFLTLRKILYLLQFTVLVGKMVVMKHHFHRFLSAYILEVPLEPSLKSTVWYSTVSWEIRQMYAMFRNDLSVK